MDLPLRVLALEPYFGGSHQAFLEGWSGGSRHDWTLLGLPARHWKWRMRHAAITLGRSVAERMVTSGTCRSPWDVLVCSDMLGLAEFRGLAPAALARLPAVAYFHENQLTYPDRFYGERDRHYGFTNLTTAVSAEQVWFNSAFHRDEFLAAADELLRRMPDFRERQVIADIRAKSRVMAPGVHPVGTATNRSPGPLRIVWAARWEHDKDPATFFRALGLLRDRGVEFQVSVLGESFRNVPGEFREARAWLGQRILHWGFLPSRDAYHAALRAADVFVSTARHEFFGLAAVEAITAGAYPLLPRRLAYPELLGLDAVPRRACHFYDGDAESLAGRFAELADQIAADPRGLTVAEGLQRSMLRYGWSRQAQSLDEGLEQFVTAGGGCSV